MTNGYPLTERVFNHSQLHVFGFFFNKNHCIMIDMQVYKKRGKENIYSNDNTLHIYKGFFYEKQMVIYTMITFKR